MHDYSNGTGDWRTHPRTLVALERARFASVDEFGEWTISTAVRLSRVLANGDQAQLDMIGPMIDKAVKVMMVLVNDDERVTFYRAYLRKAMRHEGLDFLRKCASVRRGHEKYLVSSDARSPHNLPRSHEHDMILREDHRRAVAWLAGRSDREREQIELKAGGASNREIARHQNTSESTVRRRFQRFGDEFDPK